MRFSERHGFQPARTAFQVESIDRALKNSLWNVIDSFVISQLRANWEHDKLQGFAFFCWADFFKEPLDRMPDYEKGFCERLRAFFFDAQWFAIYDFLEFILNRYPFSADRLESFTRH